MFHGEFDLFDFFRTILFVFLGVYTILMLLSMIRRLIELFSGSDPSKDMLRLYVSYHLLTVEFATLRSEILQIAFWLAALLLVGWLHTLVN